ncbi:hypothetical protein B0T12DRAFT_153993 [Alternaria alternata]|jgi:hypothetical protein|nr:hypothetical protein B0T12DRAFT_153993 [Alternaria alternata]
MYSCRLRFLFCSTSLPCLGWLWAKRHGKEWCPPGQSPPAPSHSLRPRPQIIPRVPPSPIVSPSTFSSAIKTCATADLHLLVYHRGILMYTCSPPFLNDQRWIVTSAVIPAAASTARVTEAQHALSLLQPQPGSA